MTQTDGKPILIGECEIAADAVIDPFCVIGYPGDARDQKLHHSGLVTVVGSRCRIGPFCTIYAGAMLRADVSLDPYVRVGRNTQVGARTSILYGARIHDDVEIGEDCMISGNVSNRVRLGNRVRHHGRLAHRYNAPHSDWHGTDEPSMVIGDDSVIGAGAILIGNLSIGARVYIAAGEVVRADVPPFSIVYRGRVIAADDWAGSVRESGYWRG